MSGLTKIRKAKLVAEIEKLQRKDGSYAPEDIVSFALKNPDSETHGQFEWDDAKAAHEHRLLTARHLISVYVLVVKVGSPEIIIPVISVPSLRSSGGSYLSRDAVAAEESYRQEVLEEIQTKLRTMSLKFAPLLPELKTVWRAIKRSC